MPTWLGKLLLDWVWGKLAGLILKLGAWAKEWWARRKIVKANETEAASVEAVADEIRKIQAEGKEIPPELKEKMREALRKARADHSNS
jgi:hypothetical protein